MLQCHIRVGHGRKCGGSRWNRFAICFRSKVIPLPVSTSGFVPTFQLPLSADVGQCWQCHIRVGHGRKCGVAVGIASPSVSVQKLFPLPVSTSGSWPTFQLPMSPMSDNVGSLIFVSGMVENVGTNVGIASLSVSFKRYFHFRFRADI